MISIQQLAKRDKWICHICGLRVERLEDATREHLIPKVYGGSNRPDNIALAHIWCNKLKGSKIFRVEQNGKGYVVVDPANQIISDPYDSFTDAYAVVVEMNESKLYMDESYGKELNDPNQEIVIIKRVQDRPM